MAAAAAVEGQKEIAHVVRITFVEDTEGTSFESEGRGQNIISLCDGSDQCLVN